jgi:hypothetical protein
MTITCEESLMTSSSFVKNQKTTRNLTILDWNCQDNKDKNSTHTAVFTFTDYNTLCYPTWSWESWSWS